ncbi:hypothetical protein DFH27DRAFT_283465 [Peziza echinospora]|nr:hypothetical protein DFH27DRAFT_283465 [Peziza echinospora]
MLRIRIPPGGRRRLRCFHPRHCAMRRMRPHPGRPQQQRDTATPRRQHSSSAHDPGQTATRRRLAQLMAPTRTRAQPQHAERQKRQRRLQNTSGGSVSRSSAGSAQHRTSSLSVESVRQTLADELRGNVWVDVDGVLESAVKRPAGSANARDDAGWTAPPAPATDLQFVPWLVERLGWLRGGGDGRDDTADGAPLEWRDTRWASMASGFTSRRRPDFCLVGGRAPAAWHNVHVVGEHQSAGSNDAQAFLQLADYAAQVLAAQPLRLRAVGVLSYSLRRTGLRVFLFDRGGAVGSAVLPVDTPSLALVARIAAAAETPLALPGHAAPVAFVRTLCRRPGIVCRGTYCALTAGPAPLLVKLSWRSEARPNEGALLERALSRGVVGVAQHVWHADITDLHALRRGLAATGTPLALPATTPDAWTPTPTASATSSDAAAAAGDAAAGPIAVANRIYTCVALTSVGVPVAACQTPAALAHGLLAGLVGHASLFFAGGMLHRDVSASNVLYSPAPVPAAAPSAALPAGLAALRGFLIDLDYAVQYRRPDAVPPPAPCGAPHRTGTLPFMAIGVLLAEPHAYRHDLESFLYVLLWVCCGGAPALADWQAGAPSSIAKAKLAEMAHDALFAELLAKFTPAFAGRGELAGVARRWRDVLFRLDAPADRRNGAGRDDAGWEDQRGPAVYILEPARAGWVKRGLAEYDAFLRMRDILHEAIVGADGWVDD